VDPTTDPVVDPVTDLVGPVDPTPVLAPVLAPVTHRVGPTTDPVVDPVTDLVTPVDPTTDPVLAPVVDPVAVADVVSWAEINWDKRSGSIGAVPVGPVLDLHPSALLAANGLGEGPYAAPYPRTGASAVGPPPLSGAPHPQPSFIPFSLPASWGSSLGNGPPAGQSLTLLALATFFLLVLSRWSRWLRLFSDLSPPTAFVSLVERPG
jgi:hypothetical protein